MYTCVFKSVGLSLGRLWSACLMTLMRCSSEALWEFAGAAHLAKLTKSDDTKLSSGPPLLLCQLLLSEQPAPSKARYPPIPPSSTLKISSVFVQLGVVDHFRQHLLEAADQLKSAQSGAAILLMQPSYFCADVYFERL